MKKFICLLLAALLCFSFFSCGQSSNNDRNSGSAKEYEDTRYYILNTSSKKYHRTDCSYLPSEKNSLKILRTQLSGYTGYTSCGHCDP